MTKTEKLEIIKKYESLSTPSVSDALDRFGIKGGCENIRPLFYGRKSAGFAVTLKYLPVSLAKESTANAATVSGLASNSTIDSFVEECVVQEIDSIVDMMNCDDPVKILFSLKKLPVIVLLHRGIDMEANTEHAWDKVVQIKAVFPEIQVAVAGGLLIDNVKPALEAGADVFIVGRAITASENVKKAANDFLEALTR